MNLTSSERRVVDELQSLRVAKFSELVQSLDCSGKTVQRALAKAGHFASINYNAAFVTLRDVPKFNEYGLWTFDKVRFSKHGTLRQTLLKVVELSPDGCMLEELEELLGTRVHNHVSQLLREGQMGRFFLGRRVVYLTADPQRQLVQQQARRKLDLAPSSAEEIRTAVEVPAGLDPMTVIRVLVHLLENPNATPASLARRLQAGNVNIRAQQIRQVLDFYGLKKTTR